MLNLTKRIESGVLSPVLGREQGGISQRELKEPQPRLWPESGSGRISQRELKVVVAESASKTSTGISQRELKGNGDSMARQHPTRNLTKRIEREIDARRIVTGNTENLTKRIESLPSDVGEGEEEGNLTKRIESVVSCLSSVLVVQNLTKRIESSKCQHSSSSGGSANLTKRIESKLPT